MPVLSADAEDCTPSPSPTPGPRHPFPGERWPCLHHPNGLHLPSLTALLLTTAWPTPLPPLWNPVSPCFAPRKLQTAFPSRHFTRGQTPEHRPVLRTAKDFQEALFSFICQGACGATAGQLSGSMPWCQALTLNQSQMSKLSVSAPLLPSQPDYTLTSELQVRMKLIFKLFAVDRRATSTWPIRRQAVSQPTSAQDERPEVKGLFRVQGWKRQRAPQPPVDTSQCSSHGLIRVRQYRLLVKSTFTAYMQEARTASQRAEVLLLPSAETLPS